MITVKPIIEDITEYQRGELPANAVKLNTPGTAGEMLKKAAPIAAVMCVLMFAAMFIKTMISNSMVIQPLAVVGGFMIGFVLLTVHEWLHAIVYPKDAKVTIGKLKGKLIFVALASYPMNRTRFIIMCLLPYVLGIVPLLIFILSPAENTILNGIMFGAAGMGMVSPYADVYNVIVVLIQAKSTDRIMFYEDDIYKFDVI